MTAKKKTQAKTNLDDLRVARNMAYVAYQTQVALSKAQWDAAPNPFVAILEYCTEAARKHRDEVFAVYTKAATELAIAEDKEKKKK